MTDIDPRLSGEQWKIGDVTITKVTEAGAPSPVPFWENLLANATPAEVEEISWLRPTWSNDENEFFASMHSFLVETPTAKIVVDTGVGNHKQRIMPMFHGLDTDFLEKFQDVWNLDDVDGVICTHLHVDHAGWNTRLVDGEWVPTFPNAQYYFVRKEFDHWKNYAESEGPDVYTEWAHDMIDGKAVFEDCVAPIEKAGLITWVDSDSEITPEISLVPTPGHSPGHVSVLIRSQGESAILTGDLMHFVCQVARPDWSANLDDDLVKSAESRKRIVEQYADTDTLVLGMHFPTPSGGRIVSKGDSYEFVV